MVAFVACGNFLLIDGSAIAVNFFVGIVVDGFIHESSSRFWISWKAPATLANSLRTPPNCRSRTAIEIFSLSAIGTRCQQRKQQSTPDGTPAIIGFGNSLPHERHSRMIRP
jgi:hypothetical protein